MGSSPSPRRACSIFRSLRLGASNAYDAAVGKSSLPREVCQQPLTYSGLISTLEIVDGEPVIVRIYPGDENPVHTSGAASLIGELRHQVPGRYDSNEFSVASPYPDRAPAHLGGGVLFLNESTFERATLTTFDGNDYFIVSIKTHQLEILIQDADSTYP